jgi:hypothetical protein
MDGTENCINYSTGTIKISHEKPFTTPKNPSEHGVRYVEPIAEHFVGLLPGIAHVLNAHLELDPEDYTLAINGAVKEFAMPSGCQLGYEICLRVLPR